MQVTTKNALKNWLCVPLSSVLCVQDIVHLGVKLKARLLKPSIILPLGSFVASSAHLHIIVGLHGKEAHGLRRRDIDHRDKQNFDAVEHIISSSHLLEELPDAIATKCYIDLIKASVYSYLDKELSPEKRLHEMWYAVFFVRYWRQWILLHTQFTLTNNFITSNAYMCIEINAHSLLAFVLMMRDMPHLPDFCPWRLGSQSCEKTFRSAPSITGTFSTIINFSLLGFLQRIHKLAIKDDLQSNTEKLTHNIIFPRLEKHKNKDGIGRESLKYHMLDASDEKILDALATAEIRAKKTIELLGMADILKNNNMWDTPPP